jgi:hypothetical protein
MINFWFSPPQGFLGEGCSFKTENWAFSTFSDWGSPSLASWQKKGDNFFSLKDISVHLVETAVGNIEISHSFQRVALSCCPNPHPKPHLQR